MLALFLLSGATPLQASLGPAPKQPLASQGRESDNAKPSLTANFLSGATALQTSLGPAPQCQPLASQGTQTGGAEPPPARGGSGHSHLGAEGRYENMRTLCFEPACGA